jgi:uncharacterized protein
MSIRYIYRTKFILYFLFLLFEISNFGQNKNENGYVKFTYPNGNISSEGLMINGKPEGFWKTYYVTGVVKSEGKRENFLLDSIWLFFNELGDTTEKISYLLGKKNGYYYEYVSVEEKNSTKKNVIVSKELYVNDKREGLCYYYYPDGKIKEIINYRNNKKHGQGKEFSKENILIAVYEYYNDYLIDKQNLNRIVNGKKEGLWKEFYFNGVVKSEKSYKNDQLVGYAKEYDEKGNINLTLLYDEGKIVEKKGEDTLDIEERVVKDLNGKIVKKGYYKNNLPTGIHREYDGNGMVVNALVYDDKGNVVSKGIIRDDGIREGKWTYLYENGETRSEGSYVNNRQEGDWKFYFKEGKTEQLGSFTNGMFNGQWKWFYPNGNILRIENFSNGKREGLYAEFNQAGDTLVKGSYFESERTGFWKEKVGDIVEEGNYVNDLKEGIWKIFYTNGVLMYEGNYIQGNADGRHLYYYENGKIREEQNYANGIKEKVWKKFTPEGNLFITINYQNDIETKINGINIQKTKKR